MLKKSLILTGLVVIVASFMVVAGCGTESTTPTYSIGGTISFSLQSLDGMIGVAAIDTSVIESTDFSEVDDLTDLFASFVTAEVSAGSSSYAYTLPGLPDGTYYILGILLENTDELREPMQGDPAGFYSDGQLPADPFGGTGTPAEVTISGADVTGRNFSLNATMPDLSSL